MKETLWKVFEDIETVLEDNKARSEEFKNYTHFGGISYGSTWKHSFELERFQGRFTKKMLHVSVYRSNSGMYELTSYFS